MLIQPKALFLLSNMDTRSLFLFSRLIYLYVHNKKNKNIKWIYYFDIYRLFKFVLITFYI